MIGRLSGILLEKQPPQLLLDVSGVAYEVHAPMSTFYRLPGVGDPITLHTHHFVREDAQLLYGFFDLQERSLFRSLIKVSGIGPKVALAILSGIEPDNFVRCVKNNDQVSLVRVPGVGKKTAERLIIEMRDRLADWDVSHIQHASHPMASNHTQDAISALVSLGYKPEQASRALACIEQEGLTSEELIRLALKSMADAT